MDEQTFSTTSLLHILWGGIAAMGAFFGKKYINKVDRLEEAKADKSDMGKLEDSVVQIGKDLSDKLDRNHQDTTRRIDSVMQTIVRNGK